MTDDTHVSEERARLIWRRAAELQAEAARKLEERSRALAPGDSSASDFQLVEVKAAAIEAGISAEFVELALAESSSDQGSQSLEGAERRARRFLGTEHTSIEVSRVVQASASSVLDSLQRVLPSSRFALLHVDTLGDDPLNEGVYVFEPPSMWTQSGIAATFAQAMGSVGAKRIYVSMRAMDSDRTEVAIRTPISRGLRISYRVGVGAVGTLGLGGGIGGAAAAAAITAGVVTAPLLAVPVAVAGVLAGASGLGGLTWWGFRATYRHSLKSAEEALTTMLQVIDASARSRGGFAPPAIDPSTTGLLG